MEKGVVILGLYFQEKPYLIARVSEDLIQKGIHANQLIQSLAPLIQGRGGGKKNFAQAGGKGQEEEITKALDHVRELF